MNATKPSFMVAAAVVLTLLGAPRLGANDMSPTFKRSAPPERKYTASVVSEVQLHHLGSGIWCYDSEPGYIFSDDQKLLRADIDGNVSSLFDAPAYTEGLACSQDGQLIAFFSFPKFGGSAMLLSIFDRSTNRKSEYSIAPAGGSFKPEFRSMMSIDGGVFALPSDPALISGPDILRGKKILRTESSDVFWTSNFVFVGQSESNHYQVRRMVDLADVGTIIIPKGRVVICLDR